MGGVDWIRLFQDRGKWRVLTRNRMSGFVEREASVVF